MGRLRACGLTVGIGPGGGLTVLPKEKVTPIHDKWISDYKEDMLTALRKEAPPASPPHAISDQLPEVPGTPGAPTRLVLPNTTQVPNAVLDWWLAELGNAELRVLLYLMRRTYGFQRSADAVSLTQLSGGISAADGRRLDRGTGLHRKTVIAALEALEGRGLVERVRSVQGHYGHGVNVYRVRVEALAPPHAAEHAGGGTIAACAAPSGSNAPRYTKRLVDETRPGSGSKAPT